MGKQIVIPTVPASATARVSTSDQAIQAAVDGKRVIYVEGDIDHFTINPGVSTDDLRYLVFLNGGSLRTFNTVSGHNWRVTTEDPDHIWTLNKGSGFSTRCKFMDANNCWFERVYYEGGAIDGGAIAVWDSSDGGVSTNCGWMWVYHNNSDDRIPPRDFVLFGQTGYAPGRFVRSLNGFAYNIRSRNAGDVLQITSERADRNWNNGISAEGFHMAGVDAWIDIYNQYGEALNQENFADIKRASEDPNNPLVVEDVRCFGYRRGMHQWNASDNTANPRVVNDPGAAFVWGHIDKPKNGLLKDVVIWDSNIGVTMQPGYGTNDPGQNMDIEHVIIHGADKVQHNAALQTLVDTRHNVQQQSGAALIALDDGAGGHDFEGLHIVDSGTCFSMDDPGFSLRNSAVTNCNDLGNIGAAQSSNNHSNLAFRGATTVDAAGRLARSQSMAIEMPDPADITSDVGVMHFLPHALLAPQDAPDSNFRWVIGNEAEPEDDTPVVHASISPAPNSVLSGATQVFTLDVGDETIATWNLEVGTADDPAKYTAGADVAASQSIAVTGLPTDSSAIQVRMWTQRTAGGGFQTRTYSYTASSSSLSVLAITGRRVEVAPGAGVDVLLAPLVDIPVGVPVKAVAVSQPAQGAMSIVQGSVLRFQAPDSAGTYQGTIGLREAGADTVAASATFDFVVRDNPIYTADEYHELDASETGNAAFNTHGAIIRARDLGSQNIVKTLAASTGNYAYAAPAVGNHLHRVPITLFHSGRTETAHLTMVVRPALGPVILPIPGQTLQAGSSNSVNVFDYIADPYLRRVDVTVSAVTGGEASINAGVLSFSALVEGSETVTLNVAGTNVTVDYTVQAATSNILLTSATRVANDDSAVAVSLAGLLTAGTADTFGLVTSDEEIVGAASVTGSSLLYTPGAAFAGTQSLVFFARNSSTGEQANAMVTVIVAPPSSTTNGRLVQSHGLDVGDGWIAPDTAIAIAGTETVITWCGRRRAHGAAGIVSTSDGDLVSVSASGVFVAPSGCRLHTARGELDPGYGSVPTGWQNYSLRIPATVTADITALLHHWGDVAWIKLAQGNVQQHYWAASIGAGTRLYDYYANNDADIQGAWTLQDEHHENWFRGFTEAGSHSEIYNLPNREGVGYVAGTLPSGVTAGDYVSARVDSDGYASYNGCETQVLMSRTAALRDLAAPLIVDNKPVLADLDGLPTLSTNRKRLMLSNGELVLLDQPL